VLPGVLRAFDATDVTKELWDSSHVAGDYPGSYAKYCCPTVANGKVYLGTFSNQVVVYGLKSNFH
jgi:outer membrane protein assembly factor BamB